MSFPLLHFFVHGNENFMGLHKEGKIYCPSNQLFIPLTTLQLLQPLTEIKLNIFMAQSINTECAFKNITFYFSSFTFYYRPRIKLLLQFFVSVLCAILILWLRVSASGGEWKERKNCNTFLWSQMCVLIFYDTFYTQHRSDDFFLLN